MILNTRSQWNDRKAQSERTIGRIVRRLEMKGKWVESTNKPLWYLQVPINRAYYVPKYPEMK